jgi:hypothetical protein
MMNEIFASYWLPLVPTAITGLLLLGALKKARDEKAKKEKSLVPAPVRRKR